MKPKLPQKELKNEVQLRDCFQTPNYATELLIPFIPKGIKFVWECACGKSKISNVLIKNGYKVYESDLGFPNKEDNFLTTDFPFPVYRADSVIITNPPYSLKRKFFERCIEHNVAFALLLSADYCKWVIDAIRKYGCEKIIPDSRINFITPTGKTENTGSASCFHSLWMTRYFNLGKSETFVELTKEMKRNI